MPYITPFRKHDLDGGFLPIEPGDLNYLFTSNIKRYIDAHVLNYQHINDVLGALEGAKLEFYRRVVVPYEDKKILENGDVY